MYHPSFVRRLVDREDSRVMHFTVKAKPENLMAYFPMFWARPRDNGESTEIAGPITDPHFQLPGNEWTPQSDGYSLFDPPVPDCYPPRRLPNEST